MIDASRPPCRNGQTARVQAADTALDNPTVEHRPPPPGPAVPETRPPTADPAAGTLTYLPGNGGPRAGRAAGAEFHAPGYEVLGELGKGAMGVVYKARQVRLNRLVALKVIRAGEDADPEQLARFQDEARAVARLQHPHIVQVYEVGEAGGLPYFSLEYVEGGSLDKKLQHVPQPAGRSAEMAEVLARAMHEAHRQGIVHRDLKPANVLLSAEGVLKVTDFGLAKKLGEEGRTVAGAIMGTPQYMAPEQAQGKTNAVGPAADVYALGAILYELLTGRPPFNAATVLEVLRQVLLQEPVPVRRLQPKVPRDLETVCLKCLEKSAAKRYASALDLADDLGRFLRREPIRARPVGPLERGWRWCRRNLALAALGVVSAVATLLLLGGAAWFLARLETAHKDNELAQKGKDLAQKEATTAQERADLNHYFSLVNQVRDRASRRRHGWTWDNAADLAHAAKLSPAADRLPELRTELATALAGIDVRPGPVVAKEFPPSCVAYDPSGRWLAVGEMRAYAWAVISVLLVDVPTGQTRKVTLPPLMSYQLASNGKFHVQDGTTALAFSPDGRWLVVGTRSGQLHRFDLRQESGRRLSWAAHKVSAGNLDGVRRLCFSPDGKSLYSWTRAERILKRWDTSRDVWAKSPAASFACKEEWLCDLSVSPTGGWLALADGDRLHFLAADTLKPSRPALPIPGTGKLALDRQGRTLALAEDRTIRLLDCATGKVIRTLRAPGREWSHDYHADQLVFSPDDSLLASASPSGEASYDVRLWDAAGGQLLADWNVRGDCRHLAFRPDGSALAVTTEQGAALYEVGGREVRTTLAQHAWPVRAFAFHPGGQALACLADAPGEKAGPWELTCQALTGPSRAPVRRGIAASAERPALTFAPDGRRVAVPHAKGLAVWDLGGGAPAVVGLDSSPHALRFGPGGRLWAGTGVEVSAWGGDGTQAAGRWSNELGRILTGKGYVNALAAGRRWVVVAGTDGSARFLSAASAAPGATCPAAECPLSSAALNPSETLAAVGSEDGEVFLFAVPSGERLARWRPHQEAVTSLAFAGDALLASGSRDQTVRLSAWEGGAPRELVTLRTAGAVQSLEFTPDNQRLAVLNQDERAIRLWHLDRLWPRLNALAPAAPLPPLPGP